MTSKELFKEVMNQLNEIDDITYKAMMGGYLFYYKNRLFGGIYSLGFMVKITKSSKKYLPYAKVMPPYQGAKEKILVEDISKGQLLCDMIKEMYKDLPNPKVKTTK
ncbi:competence protein TfoX [Mariniplasma anaerobium]|uniref:Competence protein TfoX n=1 Tax=Mariniplasma anaerobium TaxID=2735436 RepID=A0A7U9TIX1_9MOLU|nr:competence protein TfoX [Mariniplasma anaerobium]BCR36261.1 competence protein TfoX [Mariniplasma anaerobium]